MRFSHCTVGKRKIAVLLGVTGLLTVAAAGQASGQDQKQELANVLENLFRNASPQEGGPPASAPPAGVAPRSGGPGRNGAARGPDFVLLGVVIAGDRRMALLGDVATGNGGAHLLHLGDTFHQHRVTDVQPDRVILERGGGQQVIVRLGGGAGLGGEPSPGTDGVPAARVVPSTVPTGGAPRASEVPTGVRDAPEQIRGASGPQPGQGGRNRTVDKQAQKEQARAEKERRKAEKDAKRQAR